MQTEGLRCKLRVRDANGGSEMQTEGIRVRWGANLGLGEMRIKSHGGPGEMQTLHLLLHLHCKLRDSWSGDVPIVITRGTLRTLMENRFQIWCGQSVPACLLTCF